MVIEVDLTGEDMWEIQQAYILASTSYHRARSEEQKTKSKRIMTAMYKMLDAYAKKQNFFTFDGINIGIADQEI